MLMKKFYLLLTACLAAFMAQAGSPVANEQAITPPAGLETHMYSFEGLDTYVNRVKTGEVEIAVDGDQVYIKGLSRDYMTDGWVQGTMTDGTLVIPKALMGSFDFWGDTYELTFNGATFTYDASTDTYTSPDGYTTEAEEVVLDEYTDVVLTGVQATPATPATPEITSFVEDKYGHYITMTIPTTDVDGNPLFSSLLSYQLYYDKEGNKGVFEFTTDDYEFLEDNMTQVPYDYTDTYDIDKAGKQVYIYADDLDQWTAIGVKSIYTVGDVVNESEIFWYPLMAVGVNDLSAVSVAGTRYYDLQGRPVGDKASGLLIKQTRMSDGTVVTTKVLK